jgi:hypothetical protein
VLPSRTQRKGFPHRTGLNLCCLPPAATQPTYGRRHFSAHYTFTRPQHRKRTIVTSPNRVKKPLLFSAFVSRQFLGSETTTGLGPKQTTGCSSIPLRAFLHCAQFDHCPPFVNALQLRLFFHRTRGAFIQSRPQLLETLLRTSQDCEHAGTLQG